MVEGGSHEDIHEHMIGLALGALAHANWHASHMSFENAYWSQLSVLQAAHASELLIKARIAQEHPLLVFEQLPKASRGGEPLSYQSLIERGKTYQYHDLPDRLWATTGIQIQKIETYRSFGRLRNIIQHFAPPGHANLSFETLNFIYEVIDPFMNTCWNFYAIDYDEDYEPYIDLANILLSQKIEFLVSPTMMEVVGHRELSWPDDAPEYRKKMERRMASAKIDTAADN